MVFKVTFCVVQHSFLISGGYLKPMSPADKEGSCWWLREGRASGRFFLAGCLRSTRESRHASFRLSEENARLLEGPPSEAGETRGLTNAWRGKQSLTFFTKGELGWVGTNPSQSRSERA